MDVDSLNSVIDECEQIRKDSPLSISELCAIVGEKHPNEWPLQSVLPTLLPLSNPKYPSLNPLSIFGDSQIAIARDGQISLINALVQTGLCSSNGEARNKIKSNAVMINRVKVSNVSIVLSESDALKNIDAIVLECGKRNFGIVEMC
jgi:hypothetical protein